MLLCWVRYSLKATTICSAAIRPKECLKVALLAAKLFSQSAPSSKVLVVVKGLTHQLTLYPRIADYN